jgi:hypothetical protein
MARKKKEEPNIVLGFEIGKVYKIVGATAIRKEPKFNSGIKLNAVVMTDGKKHNLNFNGELDPGTPVLCKEVVKGAGDQIWVRCPSGWVIGYANGEKLLV